MGVYVLRDEDLAIIKQMLYGVERYGDTFPEGSIMKFEKVCNHDDSFMCSCRLQVLVEFIESKKV